MQSKQKIVFIVIVLILVNSVCYAKGFLGIYSSDLSSKKYEELNLKENYGVLVKKITEDSPAEKAGIKVGDIVLKLNNEKIYTTDQLRKMIGMFEADETINISIKSGKKTKNIKVKLAKKEEKGKKAFLGVILQEISPKEFKELNLKENYGVKIEKIVEGEAAEKAGLKEDDILQKIENDKIYTADQVSKMLQNYKPNQKINVLVSRAGKEKNAQVVLGEQEISNYFNFPESIPGLENIYFWKTEGDMKWIGITTQELSEQSLKNYKLENGIQITKVIKDSPAEKAGLKANDIITKVDKNAVESIKNIVEAIKEKAVDDEIKFVIKRGEKTKKISCKIGERKSKFPHKNFDIEIDDHQLRIMKKGELEVIDFDELQHKIDKGIKKIKVIKDEKLDKLDEKMKKIDISVEIDDDSM
ncbi:MAG: PDZ domain-containing protein [Candidatus Cloacimonetes bacterium]|nr:PDZ domain-containing protein [Candidatus Cloacimonadota bacterium]